jgi:hypothetical protein
MSSSQSYQLTCGVRHCANCGNCRDWAWEKGVSGCCGMGAKEAEWTRIGHKCRYGPRKVFHDKAPDTLEDPGYSILSRRPQLKRGVFYGVP